MIRISIRPNGLIAGVLVVALGSPALLRADNWPQFRGSMASGIGDGKTPTTWNVETGENIRWKVDVPGLAHSCPIVWGDRVYLTTAVPLAGGDPELTKGWEAAAGQSAEDTGEWSWRLLCYDRKSGKLIWDRKAHQGVPKYKRHPKSTHANCTPATDGKHIVAFFGAEGLFCFDLEGKLLWKAQLGDLNPSPAGFPDLQWGFASSPVIHDNLVIVQCDCANTSFWAAIDIETGKEVRRVAHNDDPTWATPSVFMVDGKPQVVLNGFKHMGGYDLHSGEELWKLSGGGDVPVPAPIYAHGIVFLTNGHGGPQPLYAVDPKARGDLSPVFEWDPKGLVWWSKRIGAYMPTPIVYGDNLYVCNDTGILAVNDARTGEKRYRMRLKEGSGNYTASAVAADDKIYLTTEDGDVLVLRAGNEYDLLALNKMNATCMATPAIADGVLFIRTAKQLYCIGS